MQAHPFAVLFLTFLLFPLWSGEEEDKQEAAVELASRQLEKLDTETLIKEYGTLSIPGMNDSMLRGWELQARIVQDKNQEEDRRIALRYLSDPVTSNGCKRMISRAFADSKDLRHLNYLLNELRSIKDARERGPLYWEAADNKNPAITELAQDLIPQAEEDKLRLHPTVCNGADLFLRAVRQQGRDTTKYKAWAAMSEHLKTNGGGKIKHYEGGDGVFVFVVIKDETALSFDVVMKDDAWVISPKISP